MTAGSQDRGRTDADTDSCDRAGEDPAVERDAGEGKSTDADPPAPSVAVRDRLRGDDRTRRLATVIAVAVGLGLAWLHWVGIVVGAALCSLPQATLRRGVLAGVGFGALVVAVDLLVLAASGPAALPTALAMTTLAGVTVAVGLLGGFVGGLLRGVV